MDYNIIVNNFFDGDKKYSEERVIKTENGLIKDIVKMDKNNIKDLINKKNTYDLRDKFVTPGLMDSHNHFALTALKLMYQINLVNTHSFDDIINMINNKNKIIHGWIQCFGINEYELKEKKLPDRYILDKVISDIPVFITHMSEHYAVCNSKALEIAGINKETRDPSNGKIGRNKSGISDGTLYEAQAMDLVKKHIPEYTLNDYENAIINGSAEYLNTGLTAIKDTGGTGKDINENTRVDAFNNVTLNNKIKLSLVIALPVYSLEDVDEKIGLSNKIKENSKLKNGGFKIFLDGSIMSRKAWMKNPYRIQKFDTEEVRGIPLWDIGKFKEAVNKLAATGKHISIHAIGDKAISVAIDIIKEINKNGTKSTFSLVHAYKLNNEDIMNLKNEKINLETQAAFIYFIGDVIQNNLKDSESFGLFPIKTLISQGVNISNGSDTPVTSFDPLYGIYSSIYRKIKNSNEKNIFDDEEKIGIHDALKTYTSLSSYDLELNNTGFIKNGYCSSFTVWDSYPEKLNDDINQWTKIKHNALVL